MILHDKMGYNMQYLVYKNGSGFHKLTENKVRVGKMESYVNNYLGQLILII